MMLFAFRSFHFIISVPSPSGILCFFLVWWVWSRPFHLSPIIKSSSKFICISSLLSSSLLSSPPPPFRSYAAWFQSKLSSTIHIPYIPTLPKVLQSCAKSQYNPIVDGPPPYEVKQSQTRDLLEEVTVYSTTVFLPRGSVAKLSRSLLRGSLKKRAGYDTRGRTSVILTIYPCSSSSSYHFDYKFMDPFFLIFDFFFDLRERGIV